MIAMDGDQVKVEDSILLSIKKLLGMDPIEFTQYDTDLIIHINTFIEFLNQLGVDIPEGFKINDENALWSDYLNKPEYNDIKDSIKNYIYLRVRLVFDPSTNSSLLNSINDTIKELEWRIRTYIEFYE